MGRWRQRLIKGGLALLAVLLTVWLFWSDRNLDNTLDLRGAVGAADTLEQARTVLEDDKIQPEFPRPVSRDLSATTTTLEPRFVGRDVDGRQWKVLADAAHHSGAGDASEQVALDGVDATAIDRDGDPLTFVADHGFYIKADHMLRLTDNVKIGGQGILLEAQDVWSDLNERRAWSEEPVHISSEQGELFAKTMEILHNGEIIRLVGDVSGTLYLVE